MPVMTNAVLTRVLDQHGAQREFNMPVHWRGRSSHVHGWRRGRAQVHSHWTSSSATHVWIRPRSAHASPTKRLWDFKLTILL